MQISDIINRKNYFVGYFIPPPQKKIIIIEKKKEIQNDLKLPYYSCLDMQMSIVWNPQI